MFNKSLFLVVLGMVSACGTNERIDPNMEPVAEVAAGVKEAEGSDGQLKLVSVLPKCDMALDGRMFYLRTDKRAYVCDGGSKKWEDLFTEKKVQHLVYNGIVLGEIIAINHESYYVKYGELDFQFYRNKRPITGAVGSPNPVFACEGGGVRSRGLVYFQNELMWSREICSEFLVVVPEELGNNLRKALGDDLIFDPKYAVVK